LAEREHVQVEYRAVGEAVAEPREGLVDVLRSGRDVLAAIVVLVRRLHLLIEDRVVIALIENQQPLVTQRRVVLGERLTTIVLVVEMGERVAEANHGIVEIMDVTIQPTPVRLNGAQDVSATMSILECL